MLHVVNLEWVGRLEPFVRLLKGAYDLQLGYFDHRHGKSTPTTKQGFHVLRKIGGWV